MEFKELNDNQRRLFINSGQTFDAWRDAVERYAKYKGGMTWKTAAGVDVFVADHSVHPGDS